jgi:hypothetical protein
MYYTYYIILCINTGRIIPRHNTGVSATSRVPRVICKPQVGAIYAVRTGGGAGTPGCYRPASIRQETLMSTEAQIRVNRCCLSSSVNRVHLAKMHFQGLKRVKCSRLRRTSRRVLYCIVYYARLRAGQLLYYVLYVLYYITYYIILCIVGPCCCEVRVCMAIWYTAGESDLREGCVV